MIDLIPPEGATEEQIDAFVASLRIDARARVRQLLAAGAPEVEVAEYIAGLEPLPADAVSTALSTEGVER